MGWRLVLRFVAALAVIVAYLFGTAGRWDLPMFWAVLAVWFGVGLTGLVLVARKDPTLIRERANPGPGGRDPVTRKAMVALMFVTLGVAGLDVGRFRWSPEMPVGIQVAALVVVGLTMAGWIWAMWSNRFFSTEVRIQSDRGHHLVTSGPYGIVRHPGYAVAMVMFPALPIAMGSWWAVLPMLIGVGVFLRRTLLEDRVLTEELAGYAEYTRQVRHRLIPGVW